MSTEEQLESLRVRVKALEVIVMSLVGDEEPTADTLEARHLQVVAPRAKKFLEDRESE